MNAVVTRADESIHVRARALFDQAAFAVVMRASHPERRFPIAVSKLRVGALDREPDVLTAWVYGAYATVLGRLPDAEGLKTHEAWLRGGGTAEELVNRLAASDEGRETAPQALAVLDEVYVTGAYLVALGRRPDPGGAQAQRDALLGGASHDEVLRSLLDSPEAAQQLRFPPSVEAFEEGLARAIQFVAAGDIDPIVHRELSHAVRDGRSLVWLVRTALRLRGGRRAVLRELPRWRRLGDLARRRAEHESLLAILDMGTTWAWRVQRKMLEDMEQVSKDVTALKSNSGLRDPS